MGIGCNASELDSKLQRNLILAGFLNTTVSCELVSFVYLLFFLFFLPLFIAKLCDNFYYFIFLEYLM